MLPGLQRLRLGASTGAPGDKYRRADAAASREPDRGSVQRRRVTQRVTRRDKVEEMLAAIRAMRKYMRKKDADESSPEYARLFFNPPGVRTDPDDPVLKMAEQTLQNISDKLERDAYNDAQDAANDLATVSFLHVLGRAISSAESHVIHFKPGVNTEPNADLQDKLARIDWWTMHAHLDLELLKKLRVLEGLWQPPFGVPGGDDVLKKPDPNTMRAYGGFWVPGKPGMAMTSRGRSVAAEPETVTMNRLRKDYKDYPPQWRERTNPWTVETMHDAFREVISREGPYIRGVDLAKEIVIETEVQNATRWIVNGNWATYDVTLVRYSFPNLEYKQALLLEEWMSTRNLHQRTKEYAVTTYLAYLFGLPFAQVNTSMVYPPFVIAFKPPPYPVPNIYRDELYKKWAAGEEVLLGEMVDNPRENPKTHGKSTLDLPDFWGSTLEPMVFYQLDDMVRNASDYGYK
jgi:hypothetical protein